MKLKRILKKSAIAAAVNAHFKCWNTKRRYNALCDRYGTRSILREPDAIAQLTRERWGLEDTGEPPARKRVLFVGTDYEQDRSGTLQALRETTELTVFEHAPGRYGQLWPRSPAEYDETRHHNARVLRETIARVGPLDAIVGQMWGLSMHWRALADMRERGIAVVNIAMDDRHAWQVRRLPDGTAAGTLGIAPYLTLGLTDAAECVDWYAAEGTRALFFPEASDPDLFSPQDVEKEYDVSFVGASYGIRGAIVQALERAGIRVQAYGSGWPNGRIPTDDVPSLFARSRIVLGCGTIGHCDDFVALKLRDFDAPMSGSLYLTHANPDFAPLFETGREIATFGTVEEAVESARHLLRYDAERERIAEAGRARALREHTWAMRVRMILRAISV